MYRILIVDDEKQIRELIKKYATIQGHEILEATDGLEAIKLCENDPTIDIVIMDIMMPEMDGFSTVKAIRRFSEVPVIMLSARGEEYDILHGFEIGVDDYVVKPFSPRELMMRVDAVMKRLSAMRTEQKTYQLDGLVINFTARTVSIDGKDINLSPKEYDLLTYLIENRGIALKREQILSNVWGYDYFGDDRTLDTHIKLLRRALGEYSKHIITLRGIGYRFDE